MSERKPANSNQQEAARLKNLRLALNMTTREFSKLFGKTHSTIVQWENCNTDIPEIALKLLAVIEKEHSKKLRKKPRGQSQSVSP